MAPLPAHDSAIVPCHHGHLPSFKDIFHQGFLPILSGCLSKITSNPCPKFLSNPHAPAPSHQAFWWTVSLYKVHRAMAQFVHVAHTPFKLSQISCFILPLTASNASLLSQTNCPRCEISLLHLPYPRMQFQIYFLSSSFSLPSTSYRAVCGSIYFFLVVKDSCQYLAGVLRELLHCRYIPDESRERDILHVPLFHCHLVLYTLNL